jgi:uncharacterized protein (DUF58 family)
MNFRKKNLPKKSMRRVELHLNLWLLPLLIGVFAIVYGFSGFKGWLIFLIGTSGAMLIASIWILSLERNLSIERKINLAWATVGESVPEEIKLINRGRLPALWVEITDESASIETPLRIVSDAARHSHRTRHLSHLFKRRGLYTLGPTRLRCSDPFGIYTLTMYDTHASTILVTPPVLPLLQLKVPTGGLAGDERHRRGYIERSINDVGLRNYVAGDSLKHIHWRASAHFDDLIVRQLETATSRDWWIFADLDINAQAGIGDKSTLELCVVLAASLALRGLREYRKVGLVMAGPQSIWLEPSADPTHGWRILRALAEAQAGSHSLADLLIHGHFSQAATAILITPSTDIRWVATAYRQRKSGSMISLLVDPTDFGSPVNQENVISSLARSRIPYMRIPGSLLEEAYAISAQRTRRQISADRRIQRSAQPGRPSWQKSV